MGGKKATATATVNPEGLATRVRLVAAAGHHGITSSRVSVGHGRHGQHVTVKLHGLNKHTRYSLRLVATNRGGRTRSAATHIH